MRRSILLVCALALLLAFAPSASAGPQEPVSAGVQSTQAETQDWYKNGTQTSTRYWEPTRRNGHCEYRRRSGGTLRVTCRNARSVLVYKMRFTSDKRIIDWWIEKHRGNYPCRTRFTVDLSAGRSRITFYVLTNARRARAECFIESVNVTVRS